MTSFLTRKKPSSDSADLSSNSGNERTLTQRIADTWKTRVMPRFGGGSSKPPGPGGLALADGGETDSTERLAKALQLASLLISLALVAWIGADLIAILIGRYIPEPPASSFSGAIPDSFGRRMRSEQDYQVIITRNLFNSRGLIPGDEVPATPMDANNAPVKTSLPFNLVGTMVLRNELRSIATIEDTSEQKVYPVRVDDEIPGKAKILSIEPFRVIFVNPSTGRREFVEIPEEGGGARISLNTPSTRAGGIEQSSGGNFAVPRAEVDTALSNWEKTLTEARAVPHVEGGQPAGFMLLQIVPGSVYDKLGLKNRDILCGVNGEPINDVQKAMELLTLLKTSSRIELCVKRSGKTSNFTYDIR